MAADPSSLPPGPDAGADPSRLGPFGLAARAYWEAGLVPIPCGGADGKRPLLRWGRFRRGGMPEAALERLLAEPRFAAANVGILTGAGGAQAITVVDVDDPARLSEVEALAGGTPVVVATPLGGWHLWFRHAGEGNANLRGAGLAVDLRGARGFVVAPPSRRPDGAAYRFAAGGLDRLGELPLLRPDLLERRARVGTAPPRAAPDGGRAPASPGSAATAGRGTVREGGRNDALFREGLRLAGRCRGPAELEGALGRWNAARCEPPLGGAEVRKVAHGVWRLHAEGRNWAGSAGVVQIRGEDLAALGCPSALWLLCHLRRAHGGRGPGATFAVSPKAMARGGACPELGMGEHAVRAARDRLVEVGLLARVHRGDARRGDPALFRLPPAA